MKIQSSHSVSFAVNAQPEKVWQVIRSGGNVDKWLAPVITSCRIEGGKRICGTESGEFTENLLGVDDSQRVFRYEIPQQHLLPVENIRGSMKVSTMTNGQAEVTWTWIYDVEEADEENAREALSGMAPLAQSGLETHVNSLAGAVL